METKVKAETKVFKHEPVDLGYTDLEVCNTEAGRKYVSPVGAAYPSITTILGSLNKDGLEEWKAAVGIDEANRVCRHAATRGTAMHEIVERYLDNNPNYFLKTDMPHVRALFKSIRPHLDKNVETVILQECPLYSDFLRAAGRVDLVAVWNGELSIVDFKTSRRVKTRDDISAYFQQATAYACMFEERTGIRIKQIVILMAIDDNPTPLVFVEKTKDHVMSLALTLQNYYSQNK